MAQDTETMANADFTWGESMLDIDKMKFQGSCTFRKTEALLTDVYAIRENLKNGSSKTLQGVYTFVGGKEAMKTELVNMIGKAAGSSSLMVTAAVLTVTSAFLF